MSLTTTSISTSNSSSVTTSTTPLNTPKSPITVDDKDVLSLSMSLPLPPLPRDVRAFEHDRQRVKKAEDLVKMRARKVQGGWGRVYPFTGRRGSGAARHQDTRVKEDEIDASALEALSLSDNIGELHGRNVTKSTSVSAEVKLADLVTFRSKPRKGLGLEGDFEVVPHVRSVIVLDDAATRDIEVDEPWEHIYGEDNVNVNGGASLSGSVTPTKAPSYADVLSFSSK